MTTKSIIILVSSIHKSCTYYYATPKLNQSLFDLIIVGLSGPRN